MRRFGVGFQIKRNAETLLAVNSSVIWGRKSDDGDEQVVWRKGGSCPAVKRVVETTAPDNRY